MQNTCEHIDWRILCVGTWVIVGLVLLYSTVVSSDVDIKLNKAEWTCIQTIDKAALYGSHYTVCSQYEINEKTKTR